MSDLNSRPGPADSMSQCHFLVARKNRLCKMRAKEGTRYCGEHSYLENNAVAGDEGMERIPCPYDPDHTIFAKDLEKHLKKCNARPGPLQPFFSEDLNVLSKSRDAPKYDAALPDDVESQVFRGMTPVDFQSLAKKLEQIKAHFNITSACRDEEEGERVSPAVKEQLQKDAISQTVIKGTSMLGNKSAVIEMGCGKGGLSHHLITSAPSHFKHCQVYLIDRENYKGKFDRRIDETGACVDVTRAKIDIKDLRLDKMLGPRIEHVVVISKHLCGAATCLTLAGLEQLKKARPGIMIQMFVALCCHHRCGASTFAGQELFDAPIDLSPMEFARLCGMSSWAVCGWRYASSSAATKGSVHFSGYTYDECTRIGKDCKLVLNEARLRFIRSRLNLDAHLVPYISSSITLENLLLVAS